MRHIHLQIRSFAVDSDADARLTTSNWLSTGQRLHRDDSDPGPVYPETNPRQGHNGSLSPASLKIGREFGRPVYKVKLRDPSESTSAVLLQPWACSWGRPIIGLRRRPISAKAVNHVELIEFEDPNTFQSQPDVRTGNGSCSCSLSFCITLIFVSCLRSSGAQVPTAIGFRRRPISAKAGFQHLPDRDDRPRQLLLPIVFLRFFLVFGGRELCS